ncbi:MAG: type IV pilus modification protein PilV [Sphingobacteriia bacterium]|nr:type IV pilus modification protein PilV [Sphingobacteriia bacterium]NCC41290.1 type IV pilus modification protein PilV [Gammaproteobacteria bacterium]
MIRCPRQRQQGVTLIEVLIAMLVLSIGMLGLAGLYLSALRASQDMHFRVLASLAAEDMVEHIRITGDVDDYLIEWQEDLEHRLPGGRGEIVVGSDSHVVTVTWEQRTRWMDDPDVDVSRHSFSHEVSLWSTLPQQ